MWNIFAHRLVICGLLAAGLVWIGVEHTLSLAASPNTKAPPPPVETELSLAKTKSLYLVMDLSKHVATLKARGIALRSFPLLATDWIGDPLNHANTLHLKTKDPSVSPLPISPPPVIDQAVASESEDGPAPSAPQSHTLTVADMPLQYELGFDNQLIVIIQPHHLPTFWNNVFQQMGSWGSRVAARLATWKGIFGQPSTSYLVLSMDPADAQAFYWAMVPPMSWLIHLEKPEPTP